MFFAVIPKTQQLPNTGDAPEEIFDGTVDGFWLDAYPLSNFYQLFNSPALVTAYGVPTVRTETELFGRWIDRSGNNRDALEPDAANRGFATQRGAFYSGDIYMPLQIAGCGGASTAFYLCWTGRVVAYDGTIFSDVGAVNTGFRLYHAADSNNVNGPGDVVFSAGTGSARVEVVAIGDVTPIYTAWDTDHTIEAWWTGTTLNLRIDGGAISSAACTTVAPGLSTISLGALDNLAPPTDPTDLTTYQFVYTKNKVPTLAQRNAVLAYSNFTAGLGSGNVSADGPQSYSANAGVAAESAQAYVSSVGVAAEKAQSYAAFVGSTGVTNDGPQSYAANVEVIAELAQSYLSVAGVTAESSQTYLAVMQIQAQAAQSYFSSAGVQAEALQSYAGQQQVVSDGVQSYNAAAQVQAESAQAYAANGSISVDALQNYVALQGVAKDGLQSYGAFEGVAANGAQSYGAAQSVLSELQQTYLANAGVFAESAQGYAALSGVAAESTQNYLAVQIVFAESAQSYSALANALIVNADGPQSYGAAGDLTVDGQQSYIAFESVTAQVTANYLAYQGVNGEGGQVYAALAAVQADMAQAYAAMQGVFAERTQTYQAVLTDGFVVSNARAALIYQLALLHGLVPASPMTTPKGNGQRSAGGVVQTIAGTGQSAGIETIQTAAFVGDVGSWIDALAAEIGLTAPVVITPTGLTAGTLELSYAESSTQFVVFRTA